MNEERERKPRQLLLTLDSRRRVSLHSLAKHDHYLVTVARDGVIILQPAEARPASDPREEEG